MLCYVINVWNSEVINITLDGDEENIEIVGQFFINKTKIKHSEVIKWGSQNNINISKQLVLRAIQEALQVTCKQTSINDIFPSTFHNFQHFYLLIDY